MWSNFLTTRGYPARRGQQFAGGTDSPDVICESLGNYHFEVKFTERLSLHAAMEQAVSDCGQKVPIVAHKKKRQDWLVVMRAADWLALMEK